MDTSLGNKDTSKCGEKIQRKLRGESVGFGSRAIGWRDLTQGQMNGGMP